MTEDATALRERVLLAGRELTDDVRREVRAAGDAAVPMLIARLEDEALAYDDAPGEGYAPIHAVELLAERRPREAIAPMLRALRTEDTTSILHERLARHLPAWGAK